MLTDLLKRLLHRHDLSAEEMRDAIGVVMDGQATPAQIAGFLVALRLKGETVAEITGAAQAMRARMQRVEVQRRPLLDTCGTGGDGAGTFNISTAVALVVAAAGVAVAKHGNRAVSSRSGSADVLAALGVDIEAPLPRVVRCIEEVGIGFLFAPALHPAMKHAAPVRRELGIRTIFNVLGPLTNPAGATHQLLGVFDRALCRPMCEVLADLGSTRAWVVHGGDGLDELTVCHDTHVAEWSGSEVRELTLRPEDLGLPRHPPEGLRGGTAAENAAMLRELISGGRRGALEDAVALNAGAALMLVGEAESLSAGLARAREVIHGGRATATLEAWVKLSRG